MLQEDRVKDGSTFWAGGGGDQELEPAIADWQEQLQWEMGRESWNPPRAWSQVPLLNHLANGASLVFDSDSFFSF